MTNNRLQSTMITIHAETHPTDPCARIIVQADDADKHTLDLLYQGILTNAQKEGRYTNSNEFVVFFQTPAK